MGEIILYLTSKDADFIRQWLNQEDSIAWITKESQRGNTYRWRASDTLPEIHPQSYALWNKKSCHLNVPSGSAQIADTPVIDPYAGWLQTLPNLNATAPWFGGNLPGPYFFRFQESLNKSARTIARSGFYWHGNRFRSVGKPATKELMRWWQKLQRFVRCNSKPVTWPHRHKTSKVTAYVFEDAHLKFCTGATLEPNPS